MLAMLGMAVGTGNIWRFPRIAATNGGGSFLVAWVVFLLLWSIPLILAEWAMGKAVRRGPIGTFKHLLGDRFAWMGTWVAWVVVGISAYYATVMGWTLRFLLGSILGQLQGGGSERLWESFSFTPVSMVFQAMAVVMAGTVVYFGVRGIERVARVLMPTLVVLVVILMVRAITLPGAGRGLEFLFTPQWSEITNYRIWLEALAQNAWDTGAGWGLVLCYAIYSRVKEDTNLNSFMLACGNNLISLMAGIMVLCTVFAMRPNAASEIVGAGNEGLTFVWVPRLFDEVPGGALFMVLFFLALVFAAWTSFVATFEVGTRVLSELGFRRRLVVVVFGVALFLAGVPSALSETVFRNQDFVWSVALMLSGLFFAIVVHRYGVARFRAELVNTRFQSFRIGRWWEWSMRLVVVLAVLMVVWWFWQVRDQALLSREGIGNVLLQWGGTLAVLIALNRWIVRRMRRTEEGSEPDSDSAGTAEHPAQKSSP
jgi:NSS family neurotransmitter:Na+ symporter